MTAVDAQPKGSDATSRLPLLALAVVVVVWGAGPVIAKLITVHPIIGAMFRFGISIPLLFAIVAFRRRRVSMATFKRAAFPGLAFGVNLIFVFATVQEATITVLAVTIAIQPALLLLLAGPMFGERPTIKHVAWTFLGIVGATGVILGAGSELRASLLGVILALLAMLMFTVYFAMTRLARSSFDVDPVEWMAAINVWSFVATIPPGLFLIERADFNDLDGPDLFWLAVLAYLTGVFGHVLMSWVHGFIEAARSSLYLLGMNITAVGLAWPVHDEPVTLAQVAAGGVVLWAVAAVIRLPART